jgi:hypothetical protein
MGDQSHLYATLNLEAAQVAILEHYNTPGEDALVIHFDQ